MCSQVLEKMARFSRLNSLGEVHQSPGKSCSFVTMGAGWCSGREALDENVFPFRFWYVARSCLKAVLPHAGRNTKRMDTKETVTIGTR